MIIDTSHLFPSHRRILVLSRVKNKMETKFIQNVIKKYQDKSLNVKIVMNMCIQLRKL